VAGSLGDGASEDVAGGALRAGLVGAGSAEVGSVGARSAGAGSVVTGSVLTTLALATVGTPPTAIPIATTGTSRRASGRAARRGKPARRGCLSRQMLIFESIALPHPGHKRSDRPRHYRRLETEERRLVVYHENLTAGLGLAGARTRS
jgi:hypothetical protein